eukprot:CAMPEP_0198736042 /NCGR_PEP_ID=MMETSP1475-20131203/63196_1 /TAXON_ID= ORGANISM="Unidentified sp., Strain CCMP1999" /NCGR_SAMPLE_ID=MMETSP1475 /ASSEMBLY_ACC=CAM_ASM_001111 /LENGTH=71 /DNA_ID=CAMNT_0044499789 /DNA_START=97 /DNA_END=309 /DNA_ORIENTATION=+
MSPYGRDSDNRSPRPDSSALGPGEVYEIRLTGAKQIKRVSSVSLCAQDAMRISVALSTPGCWTLAERSLWS